MTRTIIAAVLVLAGLSLPVQAKPVPRESTRRIQRLLSDFTSPNGLLFSKIEIDGILGHETKVAILRVLRDIAKGACR